MEEHMLAPSGNQSVKGNVSSRLAELRIMLPAPPTPLGAYVESSEAANLLFLSGTLPVVNGRLAISGRLGANLSVKEGQEQIVKWTGQMDKDLESGKTNFTEIDLLRLRVTESAVQVQVIDAERTLLTNELSAAQLLNQRLISTVLLIKSLGGGWEPDAPPATQPSR
jgi:enamine deaminase RidA (YjgF/YER057c/UK114 family)